MWFYNLLEDHHVRLVLPWSLIFVLVILNSLHSYHFKFLLHTDPWLFTSRNSSYILMGGSSWNISSCFCFISCCSFISDSPSGIAFFLFWVYASKSSGRLLKNFYNQPLLALKSSQPDIALAFSRMIFWVKTSPFYSSVFNHIQTFSSISGLIGFRPRVCLICFNDLVQWVILEPATLYFEEASLVPYLRA